MSVEQMRRTNRRAKQDHAAGKWASLGNLVNGHQEADVPIREEIERSRLRSLMEG